MSRGIGIAIALILLLALFIIFPYIQNIFTMTGGINDLTANATANITSYNGTELISGNVTTVSGYKGALDFFAQNILLIMFIGTVGIIIYNTLNRNRGGQY